ncbi:hypothetical protein M407DRAFT_22328 [Tulasnella calospora MUT 4182]|uniref:F-box domain-containing protein n=1 Tax=Tulasnella calospora MUT 4182 TaxID=1051891 RepID=A0A0C3M449_9AGAM|nr:hypothetical protein M407DRAFT_22328 [Tulasnella calospora MUT 4182]
MDSLIPLFILVGPMHEETDGKLDFSEPIQRADWSRYAIYASRIRNISLIDMFFGKGISNQAFQAIVDHIPPHLELPRPRSILTVTTSTTAETPQEVPMISQSLRDLNIRAIVQAAAMLPEASLEALRTGCYCSAAAMLEAFNACLTKHSSILSKLAATFPFDDHVWVAIFSLTNLRDLEIAPLNVNAPAPPSEEIFCKIRTLVERHPLLRSIQLELPLPPEESLYPQFIRNLMGLQGLETLKLRVTAPLFLSEAEVREMGASWPKMRNLQLSTSSDWSEWQVEPRTDLSLLPSFLRHLPHLEELHIALACKQSIAAPPPEQVPISALQILDVENSPDPEASRGAVVAYLAAVLPHGAHVHDWGFGPLRSFWRKVAIDLASGGEPDQPGDSEESTEEESTEESSAEESSTEESSTEEESAGEESAEDDTAP